MSASKSVKYVCRGQCKRRGSGRPGIVACPECGGALEAVTYKGQRPGFRRG